MKTEIEESRKILGAAFRYARELLDMSVPGYALLFDVDSEIIINLERGTLPVEPNENLLKLTLAALVALRQADFLESFLLNAQSRYDWQGLLEEPFPLLRLFEEIVSKQLNFCPWVSDTAIFRCRLLQLTDQSSGLLIWAESQSVHYAMLAAMPQTAPACIRIIGGYTYIFIPSAYLFLGFDTTSKNNPIPEAISQRLKDELPIGLAVPKEPFATVSPSEEEALEATRRLFIFSPDANSIWEIPT
jgi:hypothetical protein